ncbi:hypothetical protein N7519_009150 [Penicillium mononematosum]|uniref:uncharacterized protein n=1 Tax=Penicillium mononematosum TaxID=268346 RepID=UPI002548232E|nr:uncharacterized protein N7519_009150 [Penicillium mononematosum]KAJ6178689.1 hypothetical protein N7519_009150 [Penicillium mononematosum]
MKRRVSHQYFTLRSDKRYKTELQLDTAIDAVDSDYQDVAILLGDFDKRSKSTLTDIEGYHIECSDKSTNPGTLPPDPTAALGFTGSIGRGYHNVVKAKARAYDSFPGPDNVGGNAVYSRLKQLLAGKKCHEEVLVYPNHTLDYRLSAMQLASQYVSSLRPTERTRQASPTPVNNGLWDLVMADPSLVRPLNETGVEWLR